MRGRPRNSDATNALRGNAGKRKRTPRAESPPVATGTPASEWDAPAHLPAEARAVWTRELPPLRQAGYLRRSDLAAFAIYCVARWRWEKATRTIARRGATYKTTSKHGEMERLRPEMTIIAAAERTMSRFMDGLALTTASRMRAAAQIANGQGKLPLPDPATGPTVPVAMEPPGADMPRSPIGWVN